jgi:uncharacterized protein YhaN
MMIIKPSLTALRQKLDRLKKETKTLEMRLNELKPNHREWKICLHRLRRLLSGNGLNPEPLKNHREKIDYFN